MSKSDERDNCGYNNGPDAAEATVEWADWGAAVEAVLAEAERLRAAQAPVSFGCIGALPPDSAPVLSVKVVAR